LHWGSLDSEVFYFIEIGVTIELPHGHIDAVLKGRVKFSHFHLESMNLVPEIEYTYNITSVEMLECKKTGQL